MTITDLAPQGGVHHPLRSAPGDRRGAGMGPRIRREVRTPGRRGVRRTRGDALGGHRGGRPGRSLHTRVRDGDDGRPDRSSAAGGRRGDLLGRRRHGTSDTRHLPAGGRSVRSGDAGTGHHLAAGVLRHPGRLGGRRVLLLRAGRRIGRRGACAPGRSTTKPRTHGCSTAPRPGPPMAASPTSTWSSPRSTPSWAPGATPPSSSRRPPRALARGRSSRSTASVPRTPPRSFWRTSGYRATACSAARRSSTSASPAPGSGLVPGDSGGRTPPWRPSRRPARPWARMAVGVARAAYEVALDYAMTRVQFGRPIIDNQGIAFQLADMRTRIDAARLLVWRASWMAAAGKPFLSAEGSMSKLFASETAKSVTAQARPDPRRQRLHQRVPGRADAPGRRDLHHLRGHQRDPAPGHRPGHLRAPIR